MQYEQILGYHPLTTTQSRFTSVLQFTRGRRLSEFSVICISHIQGWVFRESALTKTMNLLTSVGSNICAGPPAPCYHKQKLQDRIGRMFDTTSNSRTVQGSNRSRNKFLSSPLRPYRLCGPPCLLIDGLLVGVQRPRPAVQDTYLHLAPMLMSEAITLFLLHVHMVWMGNFTFSFHCVRSILNIGDK